jgi:hypothetical protein
MAAAGSIIYVVPGPTLRDSPDRADHDVREVEAPISPIVATVRVW